MNFATSMSYRQQGALLAQYVKRAFPGQKVAMVVTNTPNFDDAVAGWEAAVEEQGIDYFETLKHPRQDRSWYNSFGNRLRDNGVEVVYVLTAPVDYIQFAQQASNQGFTPQYVGVGVSMGLNAVLGSGCPHVDGGIFYNDMDLVVLCVPSSASIAWPASKHQASFQRSAWIWTPTGRPSTTPVGSARAGRPSRGAGVTNWSMWTTNSVPRSRSARHRNCGSGHTGLTTTGATITARSVRSCSKVVSWLRQRGTHGSADTLVMFTDGITDAGSRDGDGAAFGLERIETELLEDRDRDAEHIAAVIDAAAVPYLDGARPAARDGFISGGTRRNLDWVTPATDVGTVDELELLLLADAQTSGGLLLAGEIPGGTVVGELRRRGEHALVIR